MEIQRPRTGGWSLADDAYQADPLVGADAISTIRIGDPLPTELDIRAPIHTESSNQYSNAFVIFDYHNNLDFKFAGAYEGSDSWVIGHRSAAGWITDASFAQTVNADTDYSIQVVTDSDSSVTLNLNGVPKVTHTFADSLTDGEVGLGTWNALAHFEDVSVQAYVAPPPPPVGSLPIAEDFSDGVADYFQPQIGDWIASGGRYHDSPDGDAVSTLDIAETLPANLEIQATVTWNPVLDSTATAS